MLGTIADTVTILEAALRNALGEEAVIRDEAQRSAHSADLLGAGANCALVVRPGSVEELQKAVELIAHAGLAIAPRGGGLTYVGGYIPAGGDHVAIDLRRMDRIVEINPRDMYITVEAGVTWKQIYEALRPHGLRLPFFGTFSGRGATVGGGLSNGALFLGTARYGSAAEIVLGMAVVLADGALLHTGQLAVARASKPFFRTFGPDTTGLFVHDAGALGVKADATLRLIRTPEFTDYLSFGFAERDAAIEALSEIGRSELAEDAYVMDPDKTRAALSAPSDLARDARTLAKVIGQERNLLRGLKAGAQLAMSGRDFIAAGVYSMHLVCAGRSAEAVAQDMAAARRIAARLGGQELPNSIPRAGRAEIFSSLNSVVGPTGDRWVALNAKIAHSEALAMIDAVEALIESHRAALDRNGVVVSRLLTVISNHAFSYEPVFNWHDAWLPMHRMTLSDAAKAKLVEPAAAPEARALVMLLREQIVALFARFGAASNQIGRTYPYVTILRDEPRALLEGIKHLIDPDGRMNPGALGLA
jgi:D-lactate dehydrogenase (cytochrome)